MNKHRVFWIGGAIVFVLCAVLVLFVPDDPVLENEMLQQEQADLADSGKPRVTFATPQEGYTRFCSSCHGTDGTAQTNMAGMMASKPTNLLSGPFKYQRTQEAVTQLILNGGGAMPGFSRELSPEQAQQIAVYVLSLQK